MAYIINRFDGRELVIVDDGVLDTTTSLGLVGRNYSGYGETQNENFVFLLENFHGISPPGRPISGQAWYDSQNKALKVYNGENWLSVGNASVSETEPDLSNGGLWLKSTTQQLFISDGTVWRLVGPEAVEGFNTTRIYSRSIRSSANSNKPVIVTEIDGEVVSIHTNEQFTIASDNAIPGFNLLRRGLNLKSDVTIQGSLTGNANTATALATPRTINTVSFDGTSDITIRATTNRNLIPGDYIVGTEWNGGFTDTWSVNATPENLIGTVVARDSSGSFTTTSINTTVFGELVGNVTSTTGNSIFNNVIINGNLSSGTGPVQINDSLSVSGSMIGNLIGNVTGNLEGIVTGSLIGAASLNLLKSGDTMSGDITWNTSAQGLNWSMNNDGASIKFYNLSDIDGDSRLEFNTSDNNNEYFRWTHTAVGGVIYESMRLVPNASENAVLTVRGDIVSIANINGTFVGDGASIINLNASQLASGRVPNLRLTGIYDIDISGFSERVRTIPYDQIISSLGYVPSNKAGDTFSGDISITKNNAWLAIDSPSTGPDGTDQGAGISIGESGYKGSASLHITYTGDGYSHIGMGTVDASTNIPQFRAMRMYYLNNDIDFYGNLSILGTANGTFTGTGTGLTLNASNLSTGTVPVARMTGTYNIGISGNAATSTLATNLSGGYVNATTGSFSGRIQQSASGFQAAEIANISSRVNSGFYDHETPTVAEGWPENSGWYHLLASTHRNDANYYSMQLAADFYQQELWYRSTAGSGATGWNKILHSTNFNSYSPTLTGTGASGTWTINITGNSATVSSITYGQVTGALGYIPANIAGSNISGEYNHQDNIVRRQTVVDYSLFHNRLGSRSGAVQINLESGNYVSLTCVGAISWSFANAPTGDRAGSVILELTNGGAYTQTWPVSVKWPNGIAPTLVSSGVDVLVFITDDGGITWRGSLCIADSR